MSADPRLRVLKLESDVAELRVAIAEAVQRIEQLEKLLLAASRANSGGKDRRVGA